MAWLHPEYLWTLSFAPVAVLLYLAAIWRRKGIMRRLGELDLVRRLAWSVSARRRRWTRQDSVKLLATSRGK